MKAILCRSKHELDIFDQLFYEYWKELGKALDAKQEDINSKVKAYRQQSPFKSLKAWLRGDNHNNIEETAAYSIHGSLAQRDFSAVPDDELDELMQIISRLSKKLAARTNRRYSSSRKTEAFDLRQTVRRSLRRGGELLDIVHRKHKRNRVKLILICDISRSMELYSVFLIQFMYAFQRVYKHMETFVFSTALKRITPLLKQKNFGEALNLLSLETHGWAGGTKIGESLDTFVKEYGKNLLDSKTMLIILSDGWDMGGTDTLKKNMDYIHNRAKKIIWLNPLAGYSEFNPTAAGMKAAMPYIDVFAPVHNAKSLGQLSKWL